MSEDFSVVSLDNVSFAYNAAPVLENVSFTIQSGDFVSIVGPNGGGKTTLLKLMVGLLKPDHGQVLVFGQPPERVRHRIGYMTQHVQFDPQFPVTVLDVVLMGRLGNRRADHYNRADRRKAEQALELIGLSDLKDRHLGELSGGQRQRVLLARALASEPDLLLLDEPTASADIIIGGRFFEILKELSHTMNIVLVSHDLGFVAKVVNKVICVNRSLVVHPTSNITGEIIQEIYGCEVKMVRHDHQQRENGRIIMEADQGKSKGTGP
ncbi:ABC transporter ATP-binding protein [bacterium]|nr:ABC transporter ATP-binding protein [bacterium]